MRVPALKLTQSDNDLYLFKAPAKTLWDILDINKRTDDKDDGYQRALSTSRADDIRKFVNAGRVIAPAIVVSLDNTTFDPHSSELEIPDDPHSGWVIDGQHRLRGAELADQDGAEIELPVVAFLGLDQVSQISQFVTINREAKGVPTSLYYDLLKLLPSKKTQSEIAKEKAAAIAEVLRKDDQSPFFNRIVVVTAPKKGEISLTNFVRKVAPLITENKGIFAAYSQKEVTGIIDNYFTALKSVFPDEFSLSKQRFFQTLGFGAAMNALHTIFSLTMKETGGFRVQDVERILLKAEDFNFSDWDGLGTGSAAEIQSGRDFETHVKIRHQDDTDGGSLLRLT